MRGKGLSVCCALLLLSVLSGAPAIGETPAGAKGFSHTFRNSRYSWLIVNITHDSPNFNCHVSLVRDGSLPLGWGGAQV